MKKLKQETKTVETTNHDKRVSINEVFNENMDRRFKCKKYEADFKSSSLLKLNIKEQHQLEL